MRISFVEPIKQGACSPEGIVIALLRQIPCRNSQPNEQSIVIIAAHGEHYLPVLFMVAHGFSGWALVGITSCPDRFPVCLRRYSRKSCSSPAAALSSAPIRVLTQWT